MNRRAIAILLTMVFGVTACTPTSDGHFVKARSTSPANAIKWEDCTEIVEEVVGDDADKFTVECGKLAVPQDWFVSDSPSTANIGLIRLRYKQQKKRIGSLLMNPGGPGGSGIEIAAAAPLLLPPDIYERFDIIGFDPRGVGKSDAIRCVDATFKDKSAATDPDPREQRDFDAAAEQAREFVQGCEEDKREDLPTFNTEQTAYDMEAIREAVGDEKLTYLGYSYGTLLGAVYAQIFPQRIRALVLDGAVDPELDPTQASEGQAAGFERAFDNLAQNCATRGERCKIGPDARATVNRILEKVRAQPVESDDGRTVTVGHVMLALVSSLYSREGWAVLERGLAAIEEGDPTDLLYLSDGYTGRDEDGDYNNSSDANTTINCVDSAQEPPTAEQVRGLQEEWRQKYPLFGAPLAMTMLTCTGWPTDAHNPYPVGVAQGAPPIMVVGTTGDPATPYENTAKLAETLGSGFVVTQEGEGHTSYPMASSCVRETVNAYLLDLAVPNTEVRCQPRR